jgi:asparagine synthetase B (glutamine-hydrolysing)
VAGIAGVTFDAAGPDAWADFLAAIDLPGTGHRALAGNEHGAFATAVVSPRLLGERHREDSSLLTQVAGYVVADEAHDWTAVADDLRDGGTDTLASLSGRFAVALLDRHAGLLHLITDPVGQYPLYMVQRPRGVAFATTPAAFSRLDQSPPINERWFRELFFLNFPVSGECFFHGVERLPPGNVRTISLSSGHTTDRTYAPHLEAEPRDTTRRQEMVWARQVFSRRMPLYLRDDESAILGLSSGFDSRTVLAQFLDHPGLSTYTYGVPGCPDMRAACTLARRLQLDHRSVPFDDHFERLLPRLMSATVWLSGGAQTVLRSTLLHAYAQAAGADRRADVLLSGASGDHLFRGQGNVPSIVSPLVDCLFRTGQLPDELAILSARLFHDPAAAVSQMQEARETLERRHGPLEDPAAHLGYLTYEVPASYFAGEATLAEHFLDYRTPFCDRDILNLAWSTTLGTLRSSRFRNGLTAGNLQRNYLAANLIAIHPRLRHEWIQGRPLGAFRSGSPAMYLALSGLCWAIRRLRGSAPEPRMESWPRWFAGSMRPVIERLLAPGAGIEAIVRRPFIERALARRDVYWLNKLVSAEIVIRLLESRWQLGAVDASAPRPGTAASASMPRVVAGGR